jgi:hypothetical protein
VRSVSSRSMVGIVIFGPVVKRLVFLFRPLSYVHSVAG